MYDVSLKKRPCIPIQRVRWKHGVRVKTGADGVPGARRADHALLRECETVPKPSDYRRAFTREKVNASLAFAIASTNPRFNWVLAPAGARPAFFRFFTATSSLLGNLGVLASGEPAGVDCVQFGVSTKFIGNFSGNFSRIFLALKRGIRDSLFIDNTA